MFSTIKRRWRFNQSPLFLEFLKGRWDLECTPWGNPTYNLFGWQRPCYLLQEGYCETFQELLDTTEWSNYGRQSGNDNCQDCMVHCGYEPTAVSETFGSLKGFLATVKLTLLGAKSEPLDDLPTLAGKQASPPAPAQLVQLQVNADTEEADKQTVGS